MTQCIIIDYTAEKFRKPIIQVMSITALSTPSQIKCADLTTENYKSEDWGIKISYFNDSDYVIRHLDDDGPLYYPHMR